MKCITLTMAAGMSAAAMALDVAKATWKVPNWCPIVSGQGMVKFAELKYGKFMDLTRYGVFDKQIER